jgi:deoxyribonuclease V
VRYRELHSWDVSTGEAKEIQEKIRDDVSYEPLDTQNIKTIAAVDISSARGDSHVHAAIVIMDIDSLEVVEEQWATVEDTFPYVPGLLSFREGPAIIAAWQKVKTEPDAVIFDGQGFAHPRRFGLASHLGLWLDTPSIGVAKKKLVGEFEELGEIKWSLAPLMDGHERIGTVLRSRENVKPIFISPGHKADIISSLEPVRKSIDKFRLPEPSRAAHKLCNKVRTGKV